MLTHGGSVSGKMHVDTDVDAARLEAYATCLLWLSGHGRRKRLPHLNHRLKPVLPADHSDFKELSIESALFSP
jgi:hypothetical protein